MRPIEERIPRPVTKARNSAEVYTADSITFRSMVGFGHAGDAI